MTFVIVVGTGILLATGCVNACCWTVIRPDEVAAMACSCAVTHVMAAPIPRFGAVWLEAVCRVPKAARVVMMVLIRAGSISLSALRRSGSIRGELRTAVAAEVVAACAVATWATRGAVTAVAADAERNRRRLGLLRAGTALFSMPSN